MKAKKIILGILLAIGTTVPAWSETRYVGGDVSLLPEYASAKYKDTTGKAIPDLLTFCYDEGMNCMRVRLFVNPGDFPNNDPNAKQDLSYIIPICKKIKETGFDLMLDFHYSDTWADPAKQWTPKAWQGLTDEQLYQKIYDYTKECLVTLKENGATPDFIQPGNEISYGMLWGAATASPSSLKKTFMGNDANWDRLGKLLSNAIKACREECPEAGIVIHTERVAQVNVLTNFYNQMKKLNVDYDIIGLSYYPYFHGTLSVLEGALNSLEQGFPDKKIMIVETGYPYAWEVPGTDKPVDYPYSEAGQNKFAQELVALLLNHESVNGLFWWWFEYNAYGTNLSGWYNAPLFSSLTGRATPALKTICSYGTGHDTLVSPIVDMSTQLSDKWYDLNGRPIAPPTAPGLYINGNRKILIQGS